MRQIAPGLSRFTFVWPNAFNAYYLETENECVVVDTSTRWDWLLIRRQLRGRRVDAVVLTHAHPDHQGCAAKICQEFAAPLVCHKDDAESAEGRAPLVRQNPLLEVIGNLFWAGKRSPVARVLEEGDDIAGFRVHHMPGHTPGHIVLFRPADRVAIAGDVINTNDYVTGILPLVRESPRIFSVDPAENRRSIRKLLALQPALICPGHGPPLRRIERLTKLVARLK